MTRTCPWVEFAREAGTYTGSAVTKAWGNRKDKVVVLDDDPTGCQTVHDVPVWFDWDEATLRTALTGPHRLSYILTNIRSTSAVEAEARHQEVAVRLRALAAEFGIRVHVISRSDSTLRGHFPADLRPFWSIHPQANVPSAILLIPAFLEGGRYTFHGTHYVVQEDTCVPASDTEFARDPAFGFSTAYLPNWVAEKWPDLPGEVQVLSIETIRTGVDAVIQVLREAENLQVIAVDALDYRDLEVLSLACLELQREGQEFLFRTGASFVRAYGGIPEQGLLKAENLVPLSPTGGLVLVGSYVGKTTTQLQRLLEGGTLTAVELAVDRIVAGDASREVAQAIEEVSKALAAGQDVVCYTSRQLWQSTSAEESLRVGRAVADAVNAVVAGLTIRPAFLVAKGGITSHEVAQIGLSVRETWVLGQIASGVPVWELRSESKWPNLPYVVFPGNVGTTETLATVVEELSRARQRPV